MNNTIGYIYITKNVQNNKVYVGQSTRLDCKNNYLGSGRIFKNAIKKYGKENFKKIILGFCESENELNDAEQICIEFFNSIDPIYGYNIRSGGTNSKMSEATKEKIRASETGKIVTDATRRKISECKKRPKIN